MYLIGTEQKDHGCPRAVRPVTGAAIRSIATGTNHCERTLQPFPLSLWKRPTGGVSPNLTNDHLEAGDPEVSQDSALQIENEGIPEYVHRRF